MSPSLKTALALSLALHCGLLASFLRREAEAPAASDPLPVLNVLFEAREQGNDSAQAVPGPPRDLPGASPGATVEPVVAPIVPSGLLAVAGADTRAESRSDSRDQPPMPIARERAKTMRSESVSAAGPPPSGLRSADVQDAVVATLRGHWARPPGQPVPHGQPAPTLPVTERTRQMLENRLRRWGENYHRMDTRKADLSWEHEGRAYSASFRHEPAADEMGMGRITVEISIEEGGTRYTTQVRMKNLSFSSYAQFVDRWDSDVQVHDDETDGRFHSNSEIFLHYDRGVLPTFHGKVTTAHRRVNTSKARGIFRRDVIFLGGLETGVRRIDMPRRYSPFPGGLPAGDGRVRAFDADTRIRFYPDGSFGWQPIGPDKPEERAMLSREATFLVGNETADLHLSGVVDGRVLVYTAGRIVIEGDLVYATPPDAGQGSDDYLGLVAGRSIEIAGPETTGPGDLSIHAAMFAKRRFAVRGYRTRNDGTLRIHGSLATGSLSATEPRYRTSVRFDRRLESLRPPRFPVTDRYEVEEWDGRWAVH